MTKSEQVDQTCGSLLISRGFIRQGNSNCYQRLDVARVYLFDEDGPLQRWRYHANEGTWVVMKLGVGPSELEDFLRNPNL